jgi:hypothetical protein
MRIAAMQNAHSGRVGMAHSRWPILAHRTWHEPREPRAEDVVDEL